MKSIIAAILLALFICAQNAYSENLKVLEINEEQQVLIRDDDTGEEWLAPEGYEVISVTVEHPLHSIISSMILNKIKPFI